MTASFEEWRAELLHVGNIVQDGDDSIEWGERQARYNRYVEMLDALKGSEGFEYVLAVFESLQAENDYGAYQIADRAAWRFGEVSYCTALINELPRLIEDLPDRAGDLVGSIANGYGTKDESTLRVFNHLLSEASPAAKQDIDGFIRREELPTGWLSDRAGILGSNA